MELPLLAAEDSVGSLALTMFSAGIGAIVGAVTNVVANWLRERSRKNSLWEGYHNGLWARKFDVYCEFLRLANTHVICLARSALDRKSGKYQKEGQELAMLSESFEYNDALTKVRLICDSETHSALLELSFLTNNLLLTDPPGGFPEDVSGSREIALLANAFRKELRTDELSEKEIEIFGQPTPLRPEAE